MPPYLKTLLTGTVGAIIALLCMYKCERDKTAHTPRINTDSLSSLAYNKGYEIAKLEEIGKVKDSIQTRYVTKWIKYKAANDTVEIVKECIANCDSAVNSLQEYNTQLVVIGAHKDTAITLWRTAYQGDSTNFAGYRDSVSAAPSKFWKGFKWGFITGNVTGGAAVGVLRR